MKIAIGNDHVAVALKRSIMTFLEEKGIEVVNVGTDSEERFNYPISGYKVGKMVASGEVDYGILICGTGVGISLSANKIKGIRAALVHNEFTAKLARLHNDANVIALGARVIGDELGLACVETFINTEFEGGRHARRVGKIEK